LEQPYIAEAAEAVLAAASTSKRAAKSGLIIGESRMKMDVAPLPWHVPLNSFDSAPVSVSQIRLD
jgi:hypothetical protein